MIEVAVLAGLGALALQGPPLQVLAGLGAVGCGAAVLLWRRRLPWALLTGVVLAALIGAGIAGGEPTTLLGGLLIYLQLHRRWTRLDDADDRVSLLLAALMLVAGAGNSTSVVFLPLGLAWAVALPLGLLPSGAAPRLRWRIALVGGAGIVASVLFWITPRPAEPELGGAGGQLQLTGFASKVELGAMDALLSDPEVVLRAAIAQPIPGPIYWRGLALDAFDGSQWRATRPPVPAQIQAPEAYPPEAVKVDVLLEPVPEGILFVPGRPLQVQLSDGGALSVDRQGGWFTRGGGRVRYTVVAVPPFGVGRILFPTEDGGGELQRALQLPRLDPRIRALAEQIAGDGPADVQLERLVTHLRDQYRYTRRPADSGAEAPLASFLFDRREGHCEYFASSLAVLARLRGIPARIVNGFVGGELNPTTGWWVVRRYHAHSWVEVHLDGLGWVPVDATPGPGAPIAPPSRWDTLADTLQTWWMDRFLAYDRSTQIALVLRAGRRAEALLPPRPSPASVPWRGLLLLGIVGGALGIGLRLGLRRLSRRLRPGSAGVRGPVARLHRLAREHIEGLPIEIPPHLPPVAAARWLVAHHPGPEADALLELAWLHYDVTLGGAPAATVLPRARALLRCVHKLRRADDVTSAAC